MKENKSRIKLYGTPKCERTFLVEALWEARKKNVNLRMPFIEAKEGKSIKKYYDWPKSTRYQIYLIIRDIFLMIHD